MLLSVDEHRASLRIERSKLAGSGENSSWVSMLLLVLLGMYLKIQENKFCVRNLTKIRSIRRSNIPGNGAKFDTTQITLRSDLYSLK